MRHFRATVSISLLLLAPCVLLANLLLLSRCEVILDVERLADLIGRLSLDHVRDRLACDIEQTANVQVVGGQDQLEQRALVDLQEVSVPRCDVVGALLLVLVVVGRGRRRVVFVIRAELNHLAENGRVDVRQRHDFLLRVVLVDAQVLQHGADCSAALGDGNVGLEDLIV